jgi:diketogulonate reductase-like aldo/keto reductase
VNHQQAPQFDYQDPIFNATMKFDGTGNVLIRSVGKPPFIYGTAWKKDSTTSLVVSALAAGFTAVDTAAQPRHYREDLVGTGLRSAYKSGICKRENLFVSASISLQFD